MTHLRESYLYLLLTISIFFQLVCKFCKKCSVEKLVWLLIIWIDFNGQYLSCKWRQSIGIFSDETREKFVKLFSVNLKKYSRTIIVYPLLSVVWVWAQILKRLVVGFSWNFNTIIWHLYVFDFAYLDLMPNFSSQILWMNWTKKISCQNWRGTARWNM